MTGDGGLHLFIELEEHMNARTLLQKCYEKGVTFSPGDVFYSDGEGANTFRLGFSRLKEEEIVRGIKIIGDTLKMKFGVEKMKIGVIMGGVSSEKQVSIMTGNEMIAHLDKNKYEIVPITLNEKVDLIEKAKDIDFALLALHGKYGEDGTVQGTLESLGIPYSGSNMLSSSICMDKNISKKILRYEGVETPDWIELTKMEDLNLDELDKLGFPLVVKPNSGGSSVGVKIVYNKMN